jgi:hypothetical protein
MTEEFEVEATFEVDHLAQTPTYYRVLHDVETPRGIWRAGDPEVFVLNGERTYFNQAWQELAYALNPGMTKAHFASLYAYNRAFTNGNGFGDDADPRADYINRVNLSSPLPAFDKTRVCGGATLRGIEDPPNLIVNILDGDAAPPTLAELLSQPWLFFHAVNTTLNGITRFPQNDTRPCLVPLFGSGVASIPLAALQKVPGIADPYVLGYKPSPYV